jgi:hypothetical protein
MPSFGCYINFKACKLCPCCPDNQIFSLQSFHVTFSIFKMAIPELACVYSGLLPENYRWDFGGGEGEGGVGMDHMF